MRIFSNISFIQLFVIACTGVLVSASSVIGVMISNVIIDGDKSKDRMVASTQFPRSPPSPWSPPSPPSPPSGPLPSGRLRRMSEYEGAYPKAVSHHYDLT